MMNCLWGCSYVKDLSQRFLFEYRTKSNSAYKVYSNRQTLRDCLRLRVLYTGKTKKNERLLKTKQCSANSLPLQTVASHCFNVTFRFLSLSKHTEQSLETIPQYLSIGKVFPRYLISTLSKEELYLRSRRTGCSIE